MLNLFILSIVLLTVLVVTLVIVPRPCNTRHILITSFVFVVSVCTLCYSLEALVTERTLKSISEDNYQMYKTFDNDSTLISTTFMLGNKKYIINNQ